MPFCRVAGIYIDAKFPCHGDLNCALIFQMAQDHLDRPLGPDIHFQIMFGTHFSLAAQEVLSNHDQRHEQSESGWEWKASRRRPSADRTAMPRSEDIPAQPATRPCKDGQEEPH